MKMTTYTQRFSLVTTLLAAGWSIGCSPATSATAASSPQSVAEQSEQPQTQVQSASGVPSFCEGEIEGVELPTEIQANLVQDGFVFVEGPVWSQAQSAFYFSEMDMNNEGPNGPPAKIHKLTLPDTLEVFVEDSGSNGLAIDETGLVACTHDTQSLSRFDLESGARTPFVSDYESRRFNSPNDVAIHSAGHVYFTDPDWQLAGRANETGVTGVYWRNPAGEVSLVEDQLDKPNGVTLSPDESKLYVGSVSGEISVYSVQSDGSLGPKGVFAQVEQPDGMAVDCAGNLYVTSHGPGRVVVLSPSGVQVSSISVAPRTTNVAFGGPGRRTLLITAGSGIYSVASSLPGLPY